MGRGRLLIVTEDPDLVADAAVAQAGDAQARVNGVGEGDRLDVAALSLDDEPNDLALIDVEGAIGDQIPVNHRVEIRVVDDVVDVAVDVVVHPPRRDLEEVTVLAPRLRRLPAGGALSSIFQPPS